MIVERAHRLPGEIVKERIDSVLDELLRNPPGNVVISDVARTWVGDQLHFRFSATKKLFGPLQKTVSISGLVTVTPDLVRLESQLPGLVSEDAVRRVLEREFDARIAHRNSGGGRVVPDAT
jgi:hypothetical protein